MIFSGKVTEAYSGRPLEGIPVSDGQNIVLTDSEGRFSFEGWDRAHVLHVDVLTKLHNDWFIYIEGHKGEFNFEITPVETPSNFSFLQVSDTEIENQPYNEWIWFARETVKAEHPAFFVHTGDICRKDGMRRHYLLMNSEVLGCPVRYTIGNHDFMGPEYGEQTYEKLYGPTWYSFDCGDIHFIALPVGKIGRSDMQSFYTKDELLTWVKKDISNMQKGKRIVVLVHDFCRAADALPREDFVMSATENEVDFVAEGLLAWVFGHSHSHVLHEYDGVFSINTGRPHSGGVDSSAGGIRKISLAKHALTSHMIYKDLKEEACDGFDWRTKIAGYVGFSTPILVDGDVVVGTFDDGYPKKCGVYRLRGSDGSICWSFPTTDGIKNDVAYADGKIYAQDTRGRLYCLDVETGALLWQVQSKFYYRGDYTTSGVKVFGERVITGSSGDVFAYHKDTGELIWKHIPGKIVSEAPSRVLYDEKRKQLIVSMQWSWLAALDIETGEMKWKNPTLPLWFRTGTPLLTDDMIYTCGSRSVASVDPDTGEIVNSRNLGYVMDVCGSPVIDGDTLYYPTAEKGVLAIDKNTLEIQRHFACGQTRLYTSPYMYGDLQTVEGTPVLQGNHLIFAASDGTVRFYNKNTAMLDRLIRIGSPATVSPVLTEDGGMIIADFLGRVTKYKT